MARLTATVHGGIVWLAHNLGKGCQDLKNGILASLGGKNQKAIMKTNFLFFCYSLLGYVKHLSWKGQDVRTHPPSRTGTVSKVIDDIKLYLMTSLKSQ